LTQIAYSDLHLILEHIRMISEGSYYTVTEDWSNDAENSALITGNTFNLTIYLDRRLLI